MRKIALIFLSLFFSSIGIAQQYSRAELDSFATREVPTIISQAQQLIPVYTQVAKQLRANNLKYNEAKCYNALRLMHAYLGQYDSATYYSGLAINTFEKNGFKKETAYLYCEGGYSQKNSNLPNAEKQMQQGLAMLRKLNDKQGLGGQYNNYGVIMEMKNELDSAGYFYQLSLEYKTEVGDSLGIPYSIMNLGTLAGLKGNFTKAEQLLNQAYKLFISTKNTATAAECIFELAQLEAKNKQYPSAIKTFNRTIETARPAGYKRLIMESYKRISELYQEMGNYKSSVDYLKKYGAIKDSMHNELSIKESVRWNAKFEVAKKEERIAKQQLQIKERNNQILLGLIIVGLLGFAVFYYIKNLQQKKKQEKMAYENKMRQERERISRDLHDNIGSQLAFIVSGAGIKKDNKDAQLTQICAFAKDTLEQLRTTVWAIKKEQISLTDFADQVTLFIEKIKPNSLIEFTIHQHIKNNLLISPTQSIHLFRVVQESISNAIKHSDCYSIAITITSEGTRVNITINDDGKGFEPSKQEYGNGLRYMQQRLAEINGELNITSNGEGTTVQCALRINTTSAV